MTIDALGGATALTSSLAALTRAAPEPARLESSKPPEPKQADRRNQRPKAVPAAAEEKPEDTEPKARDALADIRANQRTESANTTHLSILYDKDIDLFISRRVDPESGEVVRQFPYEDHLERLRIFAAQDRAEAEDNVDLSV